MTTALLALWACVVPDPASAGTVHQAFPPPAGFTRVAADDWGRSLGALPLAPAERPVLTHDGRVVSRTDRVIDIPLSKGDLQQCADSLIRLRATWLKDAAKPVSFHATSGDPIPYARFSGGETPYAKGKGLAWRQGSTGRWEDYLRLVFTWAGTWSLETYDTVRATGALKPGDLLLEGGFPGHTVVLLDVATRGDETLVLVGEGFMPAQSFHVEIGPHAGWHAWTAEGLDLGHWSFEPTHHRRFKPPE